MNTTALDRISEWFQSIGVHPIIGAFAAGFFLGFLLFRRKTSDTAVVSSYSAARPASSSFRKNSQSTRSNNPSMSPEVISGVRKRITEGNVIEAIKEIRHATGVGLADAKSIVEELKRGGDR